jgi:hypothetical protein
MITVSYLIGGAWSDFIRVNWYILHLRKFFNFFQKTRIGIYYHSEKICKNQKKLKLHSTKM